jgi:hypothetical protein
MAFGAEDGMGEMRKLQLTRRAILAGLASAPATLASAAPLDGVRFRDVRVDVSALHAKDQDEEAKWVAAVLPGYLRQTFAKYLAPGDRGAGVLVARIDSVVLGSPHSHLALGFSMYDALDSIEGVGVVLDARGREVGSYPLFSGAEADTQPNSPYQEDIRRRRAEMMALSFAQWLPGKMGL